MLRTNESDPARVGAETEVRYRAMSTHWLSTGRLAFLVDADEGPALSPFARARIALIDRILAERARTPA